MSNNNNWEQGLKIKADKLMANREKSNSKSNNDRQDKLNDNLQIYKIELELQNEELRNTQNALKEALDYYFSLFNDAPVGYLVLDQNGIISLANKKAAQMINENDHDLKGTVFAEMLSDEDGHIFRSRIKSFINKMSHKKIIIQLNNQESTYLQMETLPNKLMNVNDIHSEKSILVSLTDISEQKNKEIELNKILRELKIRENENQALLMAAQSVLELSDFDKTARKIFDIATKLIGAQSGYVAMLSSDGNENELLFLESGGLSCSANPDDPMPIRGLRKVAYEEGRVVYDNDFMNSKWMTLMPHGHVVLKNVLFAPLMLDGKAMGVIGMANKRSDFNQKDASMAAGFAKLASIALRNAKNLEAINKSHREKEKLIVDLTNALSKVKELSGLLPICSSCKKIRDDQGYWNRIEEYITEHSKASFTHGLCPDCIKKLYPDLCD